MQTMKVKKGTLQLVTDMLMQLDYNTLMEQGEEPDFDPKDRTSRLWLAKYRVVRTANGGKASEKNNRLVAKIKARLIQEQEQEEARRLEQLFNQ